MSEQERQEAELQREAAEQLREIHEVRRRIGEGGPDQHVPDNTESGRVEAEMNRAAAEEERAVAEEGRVGVRHFYLKLAAAVALPLAFIALIPALVGLYLLDRETNSRIDSNRELAQKNRDLITSTERLAREGAEAKATLCVFRSNLQERADATSDFIAEIEAGVRPPIPGISMADLQRSLEAQISTLDALSDLDCTS